MITHKQFLILHFLEGSDAANNMDQSLLETCPSWVPCHHSLPSGRFFLAKLPSAQASMLASSQFCPTSHYILFLGQGTGGDFIHTMASIINSMLMAPALWVLFRSLSSAPDPQIHSLLRYLYLDAYSH